MATQFFKIIQEAIGLNTFSFTALFYMIIRGIIAYLVGITLARFNKKLFGIRTPFNFVLLIMLGSIFANAILNANTFLPTLGTIVFLILFNGLITALAFYFPLVESFIKSSPSILVKNGEIQWKSMKKEFITERELLTELHAQLHTHELNTIETAILASDGTIHFIQKNHSALN
ncbi:MAG: YetF domain-containing protein [bacterium]